MKRRWYQGFSGLLAVLLLVLSLPGCARRSTFTATYPDCFDTVLTVTVVATDHREATAHTTAIHGILADLHRQFDIYASGGDAPNLYDLNHAGGESVPVTREIMDILLIGKAFCEKTDGALNLCIGPVTTLWHDARADGTRLPDPAALEEALTHINPDALLLDEAAMTACFSDPDASVDVGALAKGFALARVYDYALEVGLDALLVNLGGQVLALGEKPDGTPWEVSLVTPGGEPASVTLRDTVMATAGDYERTYTVDGVAYHHIIDPATGYPSNAHRATTVILPLDRVAESDALSTALFLLSDEAGRRLLADFPNAAARWVAADGCVTTTENWGQ